MSTTTTCRFTAVVVLYLSALQCIGFASTFAGESLNSPAAEVALVTLLRGSDGANQCPADEDRQATRQTLQQTTYNIIQDLDTYVRLSTNCGLGSLWRRVFYLNTSSSDQETSTCPSGWQRITTSSGIRACRRAASSCSSTFTNTLNHAYSKVCGRVIGIGLNTPDAFHRRRQQRNIERNYLDGVSITHGAAGSRTHIWSLGTGHPTGRFPNARCPCDSNNRDQAPLPPAEVGENYYCFRSDERWTGENCATSNPCCSFHNPPYFSVQLPESTTDSIELRICFDQNERDETILVLFADLYVQ